MFRRKAMGLVENLSKKSNLVFALLSFTLVFSIFLSPAWSQPRLDPQPLEKVRFGAPSFSGEDQSVYENRGFHYQVEVPASIQDVIDQTREAEPTFEVQVEIQVVSSQGDVAFQREAKVTLQPLLRNQGLALIYLPSQVLPNDLPDYSEVIFRVKDKLTLLVHPGRPLANHPEQGTLAGPDDFTIVIPSSLRDLDLSAGDRLQTSARLRVSHPGEGILETIPVQIILKPVEGREAEFSFSQSILLPDYTSTDFKKTFIISDEDLLQAEIRRHETIPSLEESGPDNITRAPEITHPTDDLPLEGAGCALNSNLAAGTSDVWGLLVLAGMVLFLLRLMKGKKRLP